jgi:hypothetical protein
VRGQLPGNFGVYVLFVQVSEFRTIASVFWQVGLLSGFATRQTSGSGFRPQMKG